MREDVEGNGMRIDVSDRFAAFYGRFDLPPQLLDGACAAPGDSLITRGKNATQTERTYAVDREPSVQPR